MFKRNESKKAGNDAKAVQKVKKNLLRQIQTDRMGREPELKI